VLPQRALSVVLVLLGVGLGLLLPRPWAEVAEAEAAKQTRTFTCLAPGGFVYVHNASDKEIVARVRYVGPEGEELPEDELTLPPRHTDTSPSFATGSVAYVTAPASALVQGVNSERSFGACRVGK
jgi:hypothetical protein